VIFAFVGHMPMASDEDSKRAHRLAVVEQRTTEQISITVELSNKLSEPPVLLPNAGTMPILSKVYEKLLMATRQLDAG
jgi:hypothetical protein